MTRGNIIQDIRLQKRMTQRELADKCGLTTTELSFVERDMKKPRESTIMRLAKALEVDFEYLFDAIYNIQED